MTHYTPFGYLIKQYLVVSMSLSSKGKYGHLSRSTKKGSVWRWVVIGLVCLWALAVCVWNTARIAALFGYHSALGQPAFSAFGKVWYWPWKLPQWAAQ
jgi:hypothetical protein